jgi:hypothetical protein
MQDTAEGFGQPIRQVFEPFFRSSAPAVAVRPAPRYRSASDDPFWHWLYLPIARRARSPRASRRIQQGRISVYLTYSFCTLLALLFFVR